MTRDQAELIVKRIVVVGHMLDELTLVVQGLPADDEDIKRDFRRGIGEAMSGMLNALLPATAAYPDLQPYK